MRTFILEDSIERMKQFHEVLGFDVTAAATVEGAQKKFDPPYDLILLDHDLVDAHYMQAYGDIHTTGTEFARWLASTQTPAGQVFIHSYNQHGAVRMYDTLRVAGWGVSREPFGPTLLRYLAELVRVKQAQSVASPSPPTDPPSPPPSEYTSGIPSEAGKSGGDGS